MAAAATSTQDASIAARAADWDADIAAVVGRDALSFCYFFFGRAKKK